MIGKTLIEIYKVKEECLSLKLEANQGIVTIFPKSEDGTCSLRHSYFGGEIWIYHGTVLKSKLTGIGNIPFQYLIQTARVTKEESLTKTVRTTKRTTRTEKIV